MEQKQEVGGVGKALNAADFLPQAENKSLDQVISGDQPQPQPTTQPPTQTPPTNPANAPVASPETSDEPEEEKSTWESLAENWRVPTPQECKSTNRIMEGQAATVDWEAFGDFHQFSDMIADGAESIIGTRQHESGMLYKIKLQRADRVELGKAWANIFFNLSRQVLKSSPIMDLIFAGWKTKKLMEDVAYRVEQNPKAYVQVVGMAEPDKETPNEPTQEELEKINEEQKRQEMEERKAREEAEKEAAKPKKRGRGRPKGSKNKPKPPKQQLPKEV